MLVQHSETNYSYCFYHMDKASQLGCFSIILLISGQVIVMLGSSCFVGRNLSPGCSKAWAFVWFIASWVTFFTALGILLTASGTGAFPFDYMSKFSKMISISCEDMRTQMFEDGTYYIVYTFIASVLYFISYWNAQENV
uniref:Uncharacterized protein n=1 Tax=Fagus sylvatica TaxID=28930 RepID=A0A2N9EVS6_FAGSY